MWLESRGRGWRGWRVGPTDPKGQQGKPHKAFLDPKHKNVKDKLIASYEFFIPYSMTP